jgi:hypothetical protein
VDRSRASMDARLGLLTRLRARRTEIGEAIFARVCDGAFGSAGTQDAEYVAGLRAAVAAAVEYVLDGIEREGREAGAIPPMALDQARRAARSGVGLDTVLRRYVVGSALLEEFILEEADAGELADERRALRGLLRAQAIALDRLLAAVTAEYQTELQRAGCSREQRHADRVRRLLARDGDDDRVHDGREDTELCYDLSAEHVGVIARGARAEEALRELARGLDRRLLCVPVGEETVWAWLGGRRPIAMGALEMALSPPGQARPAGAGRRAGARTDAPGDLLTGVSFAVGEPARGYEGWRLTHQQAQAALVVALRTPRKVTRYSDVALLAMAIKDQALARALIAIYVAPLREPRGNVGAGGNRGTGDASLVATLRAYLAAECNVSSTAIVLDVARSTVVYRLRAIKERLGRSLHPCPAELAVALRLDELGVSGDTTVPALAVDVK